MKILATGLTTLLITGTMVAQDSLKQKNNRPLHQNELGLSVTTPIIILFGGQDHSGRHTNLTYRYWLAKNHAVKALAGGNFQKEADPYSQPYNTGIIPSLNPLVYQTSTKTNLNNFQFGLGYEYMMGNKLKHGPGADIIYDNIHEQTEFYYMKVYQTEHADGGREDHFDRLDTGAFVSIKTINGYGVNLNYNLRFEASRRWVITASAIVALRLKTAASGTNTIYNFDLNTAGLVTDVSVFYRF